MRALIFDIEASLQVHTKQAPCQLLQDLLGLHHEFSKVQNDALSGIMHTIFSENM